ncbi:hypothetical protein CLV33_102267 [Jejuia pallidilutea]|uniref:Uncharacterized protein n=1 Tax=Jejuia pallidilutea TaxID=504487 RepID=A0A362X1X2_9FLAO|nr:hypothetical protein [Jejuia pallidilutea]PQV50406.1 hypothetical protein CLV33_102267 [Jejuia pallidilutea]
MGVKVISLHSYRKLNTPLNREVINFESKCGTNLNNVQKPVAAIQNTISYEAIVGFLIEFGVKVDNNESEVYSKLMNEYHKSVKFYGVKYYLPYYKFCKKNQNIFNYLVENYSIDSTHR